ncbi:hypothetical protein GGR52DRAFT_434832 [Hypoxylon sp. FL1284]|nr:hypothetical protein GGR52DRAFT_434832 [Hypoxylon sp. FL1284]
MPFPTSLSQLSLTAAILASTAGTYIAISPPNPNTKPSPATGDLMRRLNITNQGFSNLTFTPLCFLALHASSLSYLYPSIPQSLLRHGAANGLNPDLVTWTAATGVPLALILCAGVPLRVVPYVSLGRNFTFALAEPDGLETRGIYAYVQHPSYTGVVAVVAGNAALLLRADGPLACWLPPRCHALLKKIGWPLLVPAALALMAFGLWTRVSEEERMLRDHFGKEWESWHARTARFIPWVF